MIGGGSFIAFLQKEKSASSFLSAGSTLCSLFLPTFQVNFIADTLFVYLSDVCALLPLRDQDGLHEDMLDITNCELS